ncbi:MAG: hypothetical protein ACOC12_06970, partial [Bacteroidota bacterium]
MTTIMTKKRFYVRFLLLSLIFLINTGCAESSSIYRQLHKNLKKGKDIVISEQSFGEAIDLTGVLSFRPSTPGVKRAVVYSNLIFENCTFSSFIAHIRKDNILYIVEFRGDVVFKDCVFRQTVDLSYCTFDREFSVSGSEFIQEFNASNALFSGRNILFDNAIFYQQAAFSGSIFNHNTSFFKTQF